MKIFNLLRPLAISAMVLCLGSVAGAATLTGEKCGNKFIGLSQDGTELTADMCMRGNSTGGVNSPIAQAGWTDLAKVSGSATDGILTLDRSAKSWSISSASGYAKLGISIKQGNGFAFFELDMSQPFLGLFGTGNSAPSGSDISHVNAWGMGPAVVPLPAAGWLLLLGVGGLAAVRRGRLA